MLLVLSMNDVNQAPEVPITSWWLIWQETDKNWFFIVYVIAYSISYLPVMVVALVKRLRIQLFVHYAGVGLNVIIIIVAGKSVMYIFSTSV